MTQQASCICGCSNSFMGSRRLGSLYSHSYSGCLLLLLLSTIEEFGLNGGSHTLVGRSCMLKCLGLQIDTALESPNEPVDFTTFQLYLLPIQSVFNS